MKTKVNIKKSDINRKVIYIPTEEEGVITSMNDTYVFVRYGADVHSKATRPEDITFIGGVRNEFSQS